MRARRIALQIAYLPAKADAKEILDAFAATGLKPTSVYPWKHLGKKYACIHFRSKDTMEAKKIKTVKICGQLQKVYHTMSAPEYEPETVDESEDVTRNSYGIFVGPPVARTNARKVCSACPGCGRVRKPRRTRTASTRRKQ